MNNHERRGCSYKSHLYLMEKLIPFWHQHGSWRSREHFDTSKCTDEDKVIYAATMLKGEAIHWWGTVKEVRAVKRPRRCSGMISPSNGGQTVRGRILEVGIGEYDYEGFYVSTEERRREKNRQGENKDSGKRKLESSDTDSKKGNTSSLDRNYEQQFGIEHVLYENDSIKGSGNNNQHMMVEKNNGSGDEKAETTRTRGRAFLMTAQEA
uniref:Retrotransposon gag domain-containing protein n=1 Tax=Lactuca sativa TaxID=4236 RepID=A0A9R1W4G1_LACSA|nr:hypothetical protein LSAT_V11C300149750 [Lactuca sativa]